jgi:hypothetical protein
MAKIIIVLALIIATTFAAVSYKVETKQVTENALGTDEEFANNLRTLVENAPQP